MSEKVQQALSQTNFTALDWGIVACYLMISVVIGLLVKKYASTMTAYIGAGRGVGTWLGIATMTGTELGLITVMYSAEKGFKGGFAAFHIAVLAGVVTLFVGLTGFIVVPLRAHGVLTIPEYYELRYSRRTRILGGCVLAFGGILNMGLFLKIGSMFIVGITGLSPEGYALPVVMTGLLSLVLIYTVLGGMISVIITDYIQFVVLSVGIILTTLWGINQLGWDTIFATVVQYKQEAGFNPFMEGEFGTEYVLWMAFLGLVGCGVWPTAVARALAMESTTAVKRQYMWSSVSFTIRFMVPYFWGICAFVFIMTQAPDLRELFFAPQTNPAADPELSPLYALPVYLGRLLPAGLIGVISAAMIAAFMSTHDSYLLCWSSVITQDIISPLRRKPLTVGQRVNLTRVLIVVIGLYILGWGLFYEGGDAIWDYMAITGAIYFTGAFALLAGGIYWKRASTAGANCALVAGASAIFGLEPVRVPLVKLAGHSVGREFSRTEAAEFFSSAQIGIGSVILTCLVFVVVSLFFPDQPAKDSVVDWDQESEGEAV
jgi:SSS family solute:Na+ symporter